MAGEHSKARSALAAELMGYAERYPDERGVAARFAQFVLSEPRCFERDSWLGHVTGSAWVVDSAGDRCLLTHHRKLDRWLQLGGHSDGHPIPSEVALKEAREESGFEVELLSPELFDIDIHPIPARKSDPEHYHFDLRYLIRPSASETYEVSEESHDLAWVPISDVARYDTDESVLRMARKWLAR